MKFGGLDLFEKCASDCPGRCYAGVTLLQSFTAKDQEN